VTPPESGRSADPARASSIVVIVHLPSVEAVQSSGRSGVTMLARCGTLQGNPARRVVNIGRVTPVAAAAVDAPDLAGSRRERADGRSAGVIAVRLGAV
jgi:hypothetical protein